MFEAAPHVLVEEPCNRGTAPAILHALMRLYEMAPSALVALFPSDHYFGNESRFIKYVDSAFDATADSDDAVVLLGAEATGPEQAYGRIEPEVPPSPNIQSLLSVRRFVEKPDARVANELWRGGALWNTLVLIARASTPLRMYILEMPRLYSSFSDVRLALGTMFEAEVLARLYQEFPSSGFSELVLQRYAKRLTVMPMHGVEWCDLGQPTRVMQVVKQMHVPPRWAVAQPRRSAIEQVARVTQSERPGGWRLGYLLESAAVSRGRMVSPIRRIQFIESISWTGRARKLK